MLHAENVLPWLLVTALLEAATGSQLWGTGRGGADAAVMSVSANGDIAQLNATTGGALGTTPACMEACDDYQQGVDKTSMAVCIDMYRTCAPAGCGEGLCIQRFMDECTNHCSEWADATKDTLNVCQDNTDLYKCSGQKSCPSHTSRCRQKRIPECMLFCEGYEFSGAKSLNTDSEYVCQNLDANNVNMGVCMPMPCSMAKHNSKNYANSKPCKQSYPTCANKCGAGSDAPNETTTCFDDFSGTCHNRQNCAEVGLVRCTPTNVHQDTSNVDRESDTDNWSNIEQTSKEIPKWSPGMTQTEWRNEQQRVRIAAVQRSQKKDGKIVRRDE